MLVVEALKVCPSSGILDRLALSGWISRRLLRLGKALRTIQFSRSLPFQPCMSTLVPKMVEVMSNIPSQAPRLPLVLKLRLLAPCEYVGRAERDEGYECDPGLSTAEGDPFLVDERGLLVDIKGFQLFGNDFFVLVNSEQEQKAGKRMEPVPAT